MCGRFNITADPLTQLLMTLLGISYPGSDNHNAAPTETLHVLVAEEGTPELRPMRWWLTPFLAKEMTTRYAMFNAKSETAATSPAFREPFRRRRCVVPVSGFYEWARAGGAKLPYLIESAEQPGLLIAGLWDRWHQPDTEDVIESFTVLTAAASEALQFVHSRAPVMLTPEEARRWLDMREATETMKDFFAPRVAVALCAVPVSSYVNNARHKDLRCIEHVGDPVLLQVQDH